MFSSLRVFFVVFFKAPRIKTTLITPPKIDKCRVAQTNIPGVSDGRVSTPSLDHFANSVSQKAQVALGSSLEATGPAADSSRDKIGTTFSSSQRIFYIMPFFGLQFEFARPKFSKSPNFSKVNDSSNKTFLHVDLQAFKPKIPLAEQSSWVLASL